MGTKQNRKMIIPANCKIESAACPDSVRFVLTEPYLDVQTAADGARTGQLVATDGMIMAIVPVVLDEHDTSGWVGIAPLQAARKSAGSKRPTELVANSAAQFAGCTMPRSSVWPPAVAPVILPGDTAPIPPNFPNWRQVLVPSSSDDILVTFDMALLVRLAKAIGAEAVTLAIPRNAFETPTVDHPDRNPNAVCGAMAVRPAGDAKGSGAHGVLMPMRTV